MKMTPDELWESLVFCNPDERVKRLQLLIDAAETVQAAAAKQRQGRARTS